MTRALFFAPRARRARLAGLALVLLGAALACQSSRPQEKARPAPPRLTVLVVVDQLRGDELVRHRSLFKYGLRRLLAEGRWYSRALHGHARTETAAGHATIATGLYPRLHGVVDKRFFDDELGRSVSACDLDGDPTTPCSPDVLRVPTLGDRLKQHHPDARVVSLSLKDRSAVLLGGKLADVVAWTRPWQAGVGGLFGRTTASDRPPGWLERAYARIAAPDRINRIWELPRLPEPYASWLDAGPSERDPGHGTTFPHHLPAEDPENLYWAWLATPDSDRALVDLARKAVQVLELGQRDAPDLLLLSLSGFDAIGHMFGPDSLERVAAFVELDRQLGDLLDGLTDLVGSSVVLALTSDHGTAPVLDVAHRMGFGHSRRLAPEELIDPVQAGLAPIGASVESLSFPFVRLRAPPERRREAAQRAVAALAKVPHVHRAWIIEDLDEDGDPLERMLHRNAAPGRSGDVAVVLEQYVAPRSTHRGDGGSEHGSPWEYDRHVPILLWGHGVAAGEVKTEVAVIDLARTLADRWGLPPDPHGGSPLP